MKGPRLLVLLNTRGVSPTSNSSVFSVESDRVLLRVKSPNICGLERTIHSAASAFQSSAAKYLALVSTYAAAWHFSRWAGESNISTRRWRLCAAGFFERVLFVCTSCFSQPVWPSFLTWRQCLGRQRADHLREEDLKGVS